MQTAIVKGKLTGENFYFFSSINIYITLQNLTFNKLRE